MKKLSIWASFLIIVTLGLWGASDYLNSKIGDRDRIVGEQAAVAEEKLKKDEELLESVWTKMKRAKTFEDWQTLAAAEKNAATPMIRGKLFESYFWKAEHLLSRAGQLFKQDENHPTAKAYVEQARQLYAKMDELLASGINEQSDSPSWAAYLNYLKGVYYYRSLLFIKKPAEEQAKIQDLITQSANHLAKVFGFIPRDRDTEVALEILQKKAESMLSSSGNESFAKFQLEMMPSEEISPGRDFSIGGMEEGRH